MKTNTSALCSKACPGCGMMFGPCDNPNRYQVRDNWQGRGYRLYFGDNRFVTQVHGEINGRVFNTIGAARAYCLREFGAEAERVFD